MNIYGVLISNIYFALAVCALNAFTISRTVGYRQEVYKTFFIPIVASVIMAFVAFGVYSLMHLFLGNTICVFFAIIIAALVYGFTLIVFKGITADEIASLPKGKTILRLIRRTGLLK